MKEIISINRNLFLMRKHIALVLFNLVLVFAFPISILPFIIAKK